MSDTVGQQPLRILHLEDCATDASMVESTLQKHGVDATFARASNRHDFAARLEDHQFDLIIVDNATPGFTGLDAANLARQKSPGVPLICVSGSESPTVAWASLVAGAADYVVKDRPWQLVATVRAHQEKQRLQLRDRGMRRLLSAVQDLSLARDLDSVMAIVRHAARELTGADGATFVLRDGDLCFYADEEAIAPLWKGQRFPLKNCISGWVMLNRQTVVIEDIYADPRIPADAYRPTFVKSLAMVPIRSSSPIGAIGNYWARHRLPAPEEVELLQALANTTAVALENVAVYSELERRVQERTLQLESANRELEAFSYAVSHELGAPLRSIRGCADLLSTDAADKLDRDSQKLLAAIRSSSDRMDALTKDLLRLSRLSKAVLTRATVNLSALAREIAADLAAAAPQRAVDLAIRDGLKAEADPGLVRAVLENLLSNAWKYTSKQPAPRIQFDSQTLPDGSTAFFVRDNGAGFDPACASRLFLPFQRFHNQSEFPGTGIGLTTVHRIIERHGGKTWAQAQPGKGATFYFTLPA